MYVKEFGFDNVFLRDDLKAENLIICVLHASLTTYPYLSFFCWFSFCCPF